MIGEFVAPVAFVAAISATYFLRPICLKVGLVDHPDATANGMPHPLRLGADWGFWPAS